MKKISFSALTVLLIFVSFVFSVSARETALVENILSPKLQGHSSPDSFGVVVTGNGKLIVKPGQVFTTGEEEPGTILPFLISNPKPIPYPSQALTQGWQGKIVIAIEISVDGSIGLYQVMQSTGRQVLDDAATEAVQSWKFHSAVKANGEPIRTCIQIPITFQLQDE